MADRDAEVPQAQAAPAAASAAAGAGPGAQEVDGGQGAARAQGGAVAQEAAGNAEAAGASTSKTPDAQEAAGSAQAAGASAPLIGVLALQGGVREHAELLESLGAQVRLVRNPGQLAGLDGLVLPGGESSTIDRLTKIVGLRAPLEEAIAAGLPTLGTCAGLIMLARDIVDPAPGQTSFGAMNVTVRRNAFGRQVDSVEETVPTDLGPVRVAFIRAPEIVEVGEGVEIIARRQHTADPSNDGAIVGVRQGNMLGISFHPELTGDTVMHEELLHLAAQVRVG